MVKVFNRYQTHHAFRRFARQSRWEILIEEKSKIDGAYLLLKRFKNRLKICDSALEKVASQKADRTELQALSLSVDKERAMRVFNDMKLLFDTTVKQFDTKLLHERKKIQQAYEKIVQDQKRAMEDFQRKYFDSVVTKIGKTDNFVNSLALEQAKLLERVVNNMSEEYSFDAESHFPKGKEWTQADRESKLETHV